MRELVLLVPLSRSGRITRDADIWIEAVRSSRRACFRTRNHRASVTSPKVISVDRNSRGEERLGRAVSLIAEGVRLTLLEGMGLYLNLLVDSMLFSPFFHFYSLNQIAYLALDNAVSRPHNQKSDMATRSCGWPESTAFLVPNPHKDEETAFDQRFARLPSI